MKYLILLSALLLAGCNSFDAIDAASRTIQPLSDLADRVDTNGLYYKSTKPHQKVCEYKVGQYRTVWKPCK